MKNKSFFWLGIGLSPLVLGFWWMLQNKPEPVSQVAEAPKKTLVSIDFIPAKLKEPVPNKEFLLLSEDDSQPDTKKKLTDFAGKPIIVHFWATWCGACVDEIPELDKFQENFGDNFHLVVIASDETKGKAVREFYQAHKIKNLSIFIDEKGALARSMKVSALPTSIFVNTKGKELGRIIGPVDWLGEPGKLLMAHLSKTK